MNLRVTGVAVTRLPMTLSEPYTIAYQSIERFDNLLIEVHTVGGLVGLGVAAPDFDVTGEDVAGTELALRDVAAPLLIGSDASRRIAIIEALRDVLPHAPSVRAAVDMALVDLIAKVVGVPAWRMLGGFREGMATSITVGIMDLSATMEVIARRVAEGFSIVKIKGGADVESDIARVREIRRRYGELEIRFDANCGYSAAEALHFAHEAAEVGITIYEQPVQRAELVALGEVSLITAMSVMADESVMSARDCFRLGQKAGAGEQTLADMVNIKLMKVGGIDDALQVNAVARAAGIESMVGCMDECELSIAASLAFALSRRNVTAIDLDGHIDVLGDVSAGRCINVVRGVLWPGEGAGFGIARF